VATDRVILRRSLVTCLIVGVVLTAINHGDAIARGELSPTLVWQVGLTFLVPFVVATVSSAAAIRRRADDHTHEHVVLVDRLAEPSGSSDLVGSKRPDRN
jgi:hypothetical protein